MRATLPLDLPTTHEIRRQLLVLHQPLFQGCLHLTSLVRQPEQQRLFLFDQNKDRILPTIHNRRKKQRTVLSTHQSTIRPIPLPIIQEVPPDGFNSEDSDEELVLSRAPSVHTIRQQLTPAPSTLPPQELHPQPILHQTPPFASSNRQNPTGAILLRLSALGQTLKTKN